MRPKKKVLNQIWGKNSEKYQKFGKILWKIWKNTENSEKYSKKFGKIEKIRKNRKNSEKYFQKFRKILVRPKKKVLTQIWGKNSEKY